MHRDDHGRTRGEHAIYMPGRMASEGTYTANTLTSDFCTPELGDIKFLLLQPPVHGALSRQLSCSPQRETVCRLLDR